MYASRWEFCLIEPLNGFDEEIKEIGPSFNKRLLALKDVDGVNELLAGSGTALARMANLCGQLRFQIRWAQTPRVPATSVLGHMFIVAVYSYLFSLYLDGCPQRRINDFYCGLFHDLAELLTRDIITPVKRSVAQLPEIIHQYEDEELHSKILDPLEQEGYGHIRERLDYYLGLTTKSEFHDTFRTDQGIQKADGFADLQARCNDDRFDPKDGQLIKACDNLAAFIEAYSSIHNGLGSPHLYEAMARMPCAATSAPSASAPSVWLRCWPTSTSLRPLRILFVPPSPARRRPSDNPPFRRISAAPQPATRLLAAALSSAPISAKPCARTTRRVIRRRPLSAPINAQ